MPKITTKQTVTIPVLAAIKAVPKISGYKSREDWEKAVWKIFVDRLVAAERPARLASLLDAFITKQERCDIVLRIAAASRSLAGKSYREIGEELLLCPQTISTIKKTLRGEQYRSYYERGKTERKRKTYSRDHQPQARRHDPSKHARRTKYGTLHI
jgi:Trp operon repressor